MAPAPKQYPQTTDQALMVDLLERLRALEQRVHVLESQASPRAQPPPSASKSERQRILAALAATRWNRTEAAARIDMSRRTFTRRLRELAITEAQHGPKRRAH